MTENWTQIALYNGWTNKETWLVSLWYMDEILTDEDEDMT